MIDIPSSSSYSSSPLSSPSSSSSSSSSYSSSSPSTSSTLIYISILQLILIIILILFYIFVYSNESRKLKHHHQQPQSSPTKVKYLRRAYTRKSAPSSPSKKRLDKKPIDFSPVPFNYPEIYLQSNDILKISKEFLNTIQNELNKDMNQVACASYRDESEYKADLNQIESSINEYWSETAAAASTSALNSNETLIALSFVRLITLSQAFCPENQLLFPPDEYINTCRRILNKDQFITSINTSFTNNALSLVCLQLIRCLTFHFPHDFESLLTQRVLPNLFVSLDYNASYESWSAAETTILAIVISIRTEISTLLTLYHTTFTDDNQSINSKRFHANTSFYLFLSSSIHRLNPEQLQLATQITSTASHTPSLLPSFQISSQLLSHFS